MKNLVVLFPLLIMLPFNFKLKIAGLPQLSFVRFLLFIFLMYWFFNNNGIKNLISTIKKEKLVFLITLLYFVFGLISVVLSPKPLAAFTGYFNENYFFVPFWIVLGYHYLNDEQNIKKILKVILITLFFAQVILLLQIIFGRNIYNEIINFFAAVEDPYEMGAFTQVELEYRVFSFRFQSYFAHSILMGVYYVSFLPFVLLAYKNKIYLKNYTFLFLFIISLILGIILTVSRTPIAMGFVVLLFLLLAEKINFKLLLSVLIVFLILYQYLEYLTGLELGLEMDSGRKSIWEEFISFIENNFRIFGLGPMIFNVKNIDILGYYFTLIDPMATGINKTIELGLPFIIVTILTIVDAIRRYTNIYQINNQNIKLYVTYIFILFLLNNLVSFYSVSLFSSNYTAVLTWILYGSFLAFTSNSKFSKNNFNSNKRT